MLALAIFLYAYFSNPFKYPYVEISFDVSGTRDPKVEDFIDKYLMEHDITTITMYENKINNWKKECLTTIQKSAFKKKRKEQYEEIVDDKHMFHFLLNRKRTRYKQVNYVRHPYTVVETILVFGCSASYLHKRYQALKKINFECTILEYNSKSQRQRMTKELREQIAIRDNYTCRICGKYMPDGVGLHIDHIIPISKGGKSIPSNLQVLCSKCNGAKSNK